VRYTPYARDVIFAKDYVKALRLRGVMAREADRVLSRYDALVAPGRVNEAPFAGAGVSERDRRDGQGCDGRHWQWRGAACGVCAEWNRGAGLPTSIQFMSRAWEENSALAAARAYQSLTDWHGVILPWSKFPSPPGGRGKGGFAHLSGALQRFWLNGRVRTRLPVSA